MTIVICLLILAVCGGLWLWDKVKRVQRIAQRSAARQQLTAEVTEAPPSTQLPYGLTRPGEPSDPSPED